MADLSLALAWASFEMATRRDLSKLVHRASLNLEETLSGLQKIVFKDRSWAVSAVTTPLAGYFHRQSSSR